MKELDMKGLEAGLIERAEGLAEEYLSRARQGRETILKQGKARLQHQEASAMEAANAAAERLYRRQIQATQLKLQAELDGLRWQLIESVLLGLPERFEALAEAEEPYLKLVQQLLAKAAAAMEQTDLVAELNGRDLERLQPQWETFSHAAAPDKQIDLNPEPCDCSGGVRLSSHDNRVRIDSTFEGRIDRLREPLLEIVAERLFARDAKHGLLHG